MPAKITQTYAVLGPPRSGKTALCAALQFAARATQDHRVDVECGDDTTRELFRAFANVVRRLDGTLSFEATLGITTYSADLVLRNRGLFRRGELRRRFVFIDAPGGVMGDDDGADIDHASLRAYRERVVAELAEADGFILCVDATDLDGAAVFVSDLPNLLATVRRNGNPFRRIAVCLTKADAYFRPLGEHARNRADTEDPMEHARTLLTHQGCAALRSVGDRNTEYGYTWASVFGFTPNGEANFDPRVGGLAVRRENTAMTVAVQAWQPFNVLAPFLFVATGEVEGLLVQRGTP